MLHPGKHPNDSYEVVSDVTELSQNVRVVIVGKQLGRSFVASSLFPLLTGRARLLTVHEEIRSSDSCMVQAGQYI